MNKPNTRTSKVRQNNDDTGRIFRVAGPVVIASGIEPRMYDVTRVGAAGLLGEVIKIDGDLSTIQVYENTSGLKPGEPVINSKEQLSVELGPGLLGSIYDGIQRPLDILQLRMGDFISRGVDAPGLDRSKLWEFKSSMKAGDYISSGIVLGDVEESKGLTHSIMVPPNIRGVIKKIVSGKFTVEDVVCTLVTGEKITLMHRWPVRKSRSVKLKLTPSEPLITGQRVFDVLFPLAKGGTASIPGPFGAGKTVTQQSLSKWCDAEIIIYVGCGERGNEMTEVLTEFPALKDPKSGLHLMNRTVLIANTSNMPVAAREASIYTGVTIAEYYRDMGYNVALMADSTSRWAEAMREVSSRLEEMPGEEGYPAYLATRLAEFYERAGPVRNFNGTTGSLTIIGAISPAGGDFSEPVTQNTLRVTKTFWALDSKLAKRRHFPSINWLNSYSLYLDILEPYFAKNLTSDWRNIVAKVMGYLQNEDKLMEIVQLVGSDALPPEQQLTLEISRLIREFLLQQNAFHDVDTYCSLDKSYLIIKSILHFAESAELGLSNGVKINEILELEAKDRIGEAKFLIEHERLLEKINLDISKEFEVLMAQAKK